MVNRDAYKMLLNLIGITVIFIFIFFIVLRLNVLCCDFAGLCEDAAGKCCSVFNHIFAFRSFSHEQICIFFVLLPRILN